MRTSTWKYCRNGQQAGIVTLAELKEMIESGILHGDTLVWQVGMTEWIKVRKHPDLLPSVPSPPPCPATPQLLQSNSFLEAMVKVIRGRLSL